MRDFIQFIDPNTFISSECLAVLSTLDNNEEGLSLTVDWTNTQLNVLLSVVAHSKPSNLIVRIASSHREHQYSYAIGTLSVSSDLSWLELERSCVKIFLDHITQVDSPFDYIKSSIGCTANHIDTLTLGMIDSWSNVFSSLFSSW